ncbi:MAG TPA: NAD(P)/FAD-dependent oxidoreductase [Rhodanobacteraceae bacterium]
MTDATTPHVIVIGGGFGGLWATRALAHAPVRVTLIDRANHHLFQPLLYQVATAGLSAVDIAAPLRHLLRGQANAEVRLDEVRRIDPAQRRVTTDSVTLDYDFLIVATGATHTYFGHDEWSRFAPGLKTLDDAFVVRRKVLEAFEVAEREADPAKRAALLNFVIVGGGPTGVEFAGTLAEIARHTLKNEFRRINPRDAHIYLVEAGPRVLPSMPESLSKSAERQLARLGVDVHVGEAVTGVDANGVAFGGRRVETETVLWAAGVAASPLGRQLSDKCDRAGRVPVSPDLSLPDHPEVFVIGDLATLTQNGKPVPGIAPAAKQMGKYVAEAIRDRLAGQPTKPFRYRDYGNLATIGRMAAVVDLRGIHLSGLIAWWFWLIAHVFFLIGFRNRIMVLIDWAWSYWTYKRHARIIFGRKERASQAQPD